MRSSISATAQRILLWSTAAILTLTSCADVSKTQRTGSVNGGPSISAPVSTGPVKPVRKPSNVPMRKLEPGENPPQFILFSFDGVGVTKNWDEFLDAAEATDARFTALMTGLYFLTDNTKKKYRGPGHRPGEAALAFGGTKAEVSEQIDYLNRTWYAGHEMGTHYVGHFCAGTKYPGKDWSAKDWTHELDQFFSLMTHWRENTGITDGDDLAFGPEVVKGGRTQCLEGSPRTLFPALRTHDMTWDSSMPADKPGLYWPAKQRGIWEFPVPYVYAPPFKARQTALDYNFWVSFNGGKNQPRRAEQIGRAVRGTYDYMYRRAYHGNRAPLVIANHFNDWSGNAFNPATWDFMRSVCGKPETICATYSDVVAWIELQDPEVLSELQSREPVAVTARR